MSGSRRKRSDKSGLPPGSLVHVGRQHHVPMQLRLVRYDGELMADEEISDLSALGALPGNGNLWLDCVGLDDPAVLDQLGKAFNLHPLLLEDVFNAEHRPKFEDYGDYLFVVLKYLHFDRHSGHLASEQVSVVLGRNFVLSFRETNHPSFAPVMLRMRNESGRIRRSGPDFLLHALMDSVVDEYFILLEQIGEEIENVENQILDRPSPIALRTLHRLKRELIGVRKQVWPMRELLGGLDRSDSRLLSPAIEIYLRDIYDHTVHIIDTVEGYRDTLSGLLDIYLSSLSNKMNEVMKLLTIISTIFIPLTFIAGIYGMNFQYMPELAWPNGYYWALGFMAMLAIGMLIVFRRKRWL